MSEKLNVLRNIAVAVIKLTVFLGMAIIAGAVIVGAAVAVSLSNVDTASRKDNTTESDVDMPDPEAALDTETQSPTECPDSIPEEQLEETLETEDTNTTECPDSIPEEQPEENLQEEELLPLVDIGKTCPFPPLPADYREWKIGKLQRWCSKLNAIARTEQLPEITGYYTKKVKAKTICRLIEDFYQSAKLGHLIPQS